ncbi:MAG: DUF6893 family small protein [Acidobacteriaceae bacterium]
MTAKIIFGALGLIVIALAVVSAPDIQRYIKISSM